VAYTDVILLPSNGWCQLCWDATNTTWRVDDQSTFVSGTFAGNLTLTGNLKLPSSGATASNLNFYAEDDTTLGSAYWLPNASGTIALTSNITQQKAISFTAVNDQYYSTYGTITVTDPAPATNRGYIIHVVAGTTTIGGVGYTVGALVYRYYNGTSWISNNMNATTPIPTLQDVTDEGNSITNSIFINDNKYLQVDFSGFASSVNASSISTSNLSSGSYALLNSSGKIELGNASNYQTSIAANNLTNNSVAFELPNKTAGTYTLATTSYKVYTALLTQAGTSAPVATVLENTLDGMVTFEYVSPGLYDAVLTGAFTSNKTTAMLWGGTFNQVFKAYRLNGNRVRLITYDPSGATDNDQMGTTTLEIRVYN
jgi:hypothetical protein